MARMKMGMGLLGLAAVGGAAWFLMRKKAPPVPVAPPAPAQPTTGQAINAIVGNLTQAATGAYEMYQRQQTGVAGFGARPMSVKRTTPSFDMPRPGRLTMVSTPSMPAPRTISGGSGFGEIACWHPGQLYQGGTHDTSSGVQGLWF
jgi:hypothetical protein